MQNNENNTQELDNSSFSLEQRVSGDALLDAQDLINEVKSVGANVDENGYVTVYHQTTEEKADKIKQSGKWKHCPFKKGCYKEGAKSKTYSVKIKDVAHIKHMDYMKNEEFKSLYKVRYKIETKNAELKNNYNYGNANTGGKLGIIIQ